MRKYLLLLLLLPALRVMALSDVAKFAAQQEKRIATRSAAEATPRARLSQEYVLRQAYAERLQVALDEALREERFVSEETERLKAERAALEKRFAELNQALFKAGQKTPEAQEYKAIMKANAERVQALRTALWPKKTAGGMSPKVEDNADKALR